ncbi:Hypothetical protein DEACI_3166 [Acididesulfobacillus acetoxydans]|uniref:Uncharacterized protein n=1 Tax=Acididesulfobacillus acetoxydans TaxID=1561005 RepID=A0A8S0X0B7_9FIRM|nr:hypothetical protein [Acididesulfobacillus acetoxydans]CAA7602491.1 Hypothetical protein DEACI_3166 [Acididesulfobacillus acetoxydans]CEJ05946.1 Hypothetical protein DEACI_0366 [Acididesulfobacillus acetoxydans]
MAALSLQYKDGRQVPEGAGLLISILVRYAEVGSIYYWQEKHALKFTFLLMGAEGQAVEGLRNKLPLALAAFHGLEGSAMTLCGVESRCEGDIYSLTVTRDVESMTQTEVGLIVDLLRCEFGEALVLDDADGAIPEDELLFQEELIGRLLAKMRDDEIDKNVVAVRDEGRVLVFKN